MSTSEYEKLLRRLRRFRRAELGHLHRKRLLRHLDQGDDSEYEESYFAHLLPASRTYLVEVLKERADARNSSMNLLDRLLASELHPATSVARKHRQRDPGRCGWWAWLGRLEKELVGEQVRRESYRLVRKPPLT